MSSVTERLIEIRKYRNMTQGDFADMVGITRQAWRRKEKGEVAGFSPEDFERILSATKIDARWLFGQMDGPIENADLEKQHEQLQKYHDVDELVSTVREMATQYGKSADVEPVAHRVSVNQTLRDHVQMIQFLDSSMLEKINTLVYGYLQGKRESENAKRNGTEG